MATTTVCDFAVVVPTTLKNLTYIAGAIVKSTQLSAKLLSPLPTSWAPLPPDDDDSSRQSQLPLFLQSSLSGSQLSPVNSSSGEDGSREFGLFNVPFATSGYTWLHIILTTIVAVTIMVVIIFGNGLVIIAVKADKSLKGIQNYFIVSLAFADLLVGLTIMPLSLVVELMGKWIFGQIACNLWLGGDVLLCTASILNLCMISIDRYWSVTLAGQYTARVRKNRVTMMIVFVWILSTLISLPPLIGIARRKDAQDDECELMDDIWYIIYSTFGSFYAPLVVMIVVYIRIFVIARRTARKSAFKLSKQLQQRQQVTSMAKLKETLSSVNSNTLEDQAGTKNIPDVANKSEATTTLRPVETSEHLVIKPPPPNGDIEINHGHYSHPPGRMHRWSRVFQNILSNTPLSSRRQSAQSDFQGSDEKRNSLVVEIKLRKSDKAFSQSGAVSDYDDSIPRMKSHPVLTNEKAIHEASSLLGNVAMSLAVMHKGNLKKTNSPPPEASTAIQTLARQASEINDAALARLSTAGKTPNSLKNEGEDGKGANAESSPSSKRNASCEDKSNESGQSNLKPTSTKKKEATKVPQLSLAEEVERRKKRLAKERERRTTRILVIIMLSFIGCWFPFFTLYLVSSLVGFHVNRYVFATFFWLGYFNSALNPISYAAFNQDFRAAFKRLLKMK